MERGKGVRTHNLSAGLIGINGGKNILHRCQGIPAACTQVILRNAVCHILQKGVNAQRERCVKIRDAGIFDDRLLILCPISDFFNAVFDTERTARAGKLKAPPAA